MSTEADLYGEQSKGDEQRLKSDSFWTALFLRQGMWEKVQAIQGITDGIAGARRASAKTKLYVSPNVVLPKIDTIAKAMRLPSPDLMNPPESQKAIAISHLQNKCRIGLSAAGNRWFKEEHCRKFYGRSQ